MTICRVAVIGAGMMGHGIAQVAAMAGYEVILQDIERSLVERALVRIGENLEKGIERGKVTPTEREAALYRIGVTTSAEDAARGSDLVIEAVPEKLELKRELFARIDQAAPQTAIFATNTSALGVGKIAGGTSRSDRVVGMHFFNPPHLMKLVEIVRHEQTSGETVRQVVDVARRMGKTPIVVKDVPGFASSRLGLIIGLEAMRMVESGVASAEDIDKAMKLGYGHPMGPLELTDHVGLDVRLAIAEHLEKELGPAFTPPELLKRLVREGKLGKKTGAGFYRW